MSKKVSIVLRISGMLIYLLKNIKKENSSKTERNFTSIYLSIYLSMCMCDGIHMSLCEDKRRPIEMRSMTEREVELNWLVYRNIYLSIYLSIYLCVCMHIYIYIYIYILFAHIIHTLRPSFFLSLSLSLSISLPLCIYIYIYMLG